MAEEQLSLCEIRSTWLTRGINAGGGLPTSVVNAGGGLPTSVVNALNIQSARVDLDALFLEWIFEICADRVNTMESGSGYAHRIRSNPWFSIHPSTT